MATLKNTTINDTGFLRLPNGTTAERPAGTDAGRIRYNTSTNNIEYQNNSGTWQNLAVPFQSRTIISTAYIQAGYKDSTAWRNVNRTTTSNDTTTNLGTVAERSHNYQWAANNLTSTFVFGAGDGHAVASNVVTAFNMNTETAFTTGFTRNVGFSRHTFGGVFQEHYATWFVGGPDNRYEEFNLVTQTLVGTLAQTYSTGSTWGMSHETFGVMYIGDSNEQNFTFATRTTSGRSGTGVSAHHQQKSVNSKITNCYAGNEGSWNGGNNLRRTNMLTNITSGTVGKPVGNCGEENFTLGQDHQYMLGQYNGLQNNISWRFNYATESGFQGSATMEPKGIPGTSSGTCSWRA